MNLPGVAFHSSEAVTSAYQPTITFAVAAIPGPATFTLGMSVLTLGLAISRRSRALRA